MQTRIDTTFSGKDISSVISVYEYTVIESGMYSFQVRLAAVAGNGDYEVYLTLNDGDAQTDDMIAPKTTATLASGQTAVWFATLKVAALAGDVVNIFILGQAGDTSEAGSIRIFSENYSTLVITDILSDSTPFDGANVDVKTSTRATPADVDLTVGVSATEAAEVVLGRFPVYQSYTFEQALTSTLTDDLSAADKIYCSIKEFDYELDASSIVFITKGATGLTVLNKATYATAAHGSLVLTGSSGAWVLTLKIEEQATDLLEYFGSFNIEFKALFGNDTIYISGGKAPISRRYIRAIT